MSPDFSEADKSHQEAMRLCDLAVAARSRRDHAHAVEFFRRAFEEERRAARQVALEPSRSILLRSAASLAIECGEHREAERLIGLALSGDPPGEVADELRDLLEQVNLSRHLELKGISLSPDELQISIEGNATGYGMALSDEVIERVQATEKLLLRTAERKMSRPFRETGRAISEISKNFEFYLSTPRAASFALTLRVGYPQKQLNLPHMEQEPLREPEKIIDDLLECVDAFQAGESKRLRSLIPDETYRRNFVALAERLAPDGDQVKVVGLTVMRGGRENRVAMVRRQPEERPSRRPSERTQVEVVGRLLFANATSSDRKKIKVVDDEGVQHLFIVPDGMMGDVVKPLWEERVVALGIQRGKTTMLESITRATNRVGNGRKDPKVVKDR